MPCPRYFYNLAFYNLSRPQAGINDKLQIFSLTAAVLALSADNTAPGRALPWVAYHLLGQERVTEALDWGFVLFTYQVFQGFSFLCL